MPGIMFWNVGRTETLLFAPACIESDVDILLLAECPLPSAVVIGRLNSLVVDSRFFYEHRQETEQRAVRCFTSLPSRSLKPRMAGFRFSIDVVAPPAALPFLMVSVHAPSKLHREPHDQELYFQNLKQEIERIELEAGHSRTIVIGDFNVAPFDPALVAAQSMNAVMDKTIASRRTRNIFDRQYSYFYNPVWSIIGDDSAGPPGSYYYNHESSHSYFWHSFDQILLRPDMIPYWNHTEMLIPTTISDSALLKNGRPDTTISDHLPLVVRLNVEGRTP